MLGWPSYLDRLLEHSPIWRLQRALSEKNNALSENAMFLR